MSSEGESLHLRANDGKARAVLFVKRRGEMPLEIVAGHRALLLLASDSLIQVLTL